MDIKPKSIEEYTKQGYTYKKLENTFGIEEELYELYCEKETYKHKLNNPAYMLVSYEKDKEKIIQAEWWYKNKRIDNYPVIFDNVIYKNPRTFQKLTGIKTSFNIWGIFDLNFKVNQNFSPIENVTMKDVFDVVAKGLNDYGAALFDVMENNEKELGQAEEQFLELILLLLKAKNSFVADGFLLQEILAMYKLEKENERNVVAAVYYKLITRLTTEDKLEVKKEERIIKPKEPHKSLKVKKIKTQGTPKNIDQEYTEILTLIKLK